MKHEKTDRVEVYYEILLKLANSLQHKITYSFLTIVFKYGLQLHLLIATIGMKREAFQQHKETTLVCEEGISKVKATSNLLVPQRSKHINLKTLDNSKENMNVLYKLSHDKS
jgi:hypothetical protein